MANNVVQQLENVNALEIIPHPFLFNQKHEANDEMREDPTMGVIDADPLSFYNPNHADVSTNTKRRRTSSESEEYLEKDFTIRELYKTNKIQEIRIGKEDDAAIDPEKLVENLKGWTIEIRKRIGRGGNIRSDQFYCHRISKRKLRSLVEVKKCIEENSRPSKDSENDQGLKVDGIDGTSMSPNIANELDSGMIRGEELVKENTSTRKSKSKSIRCSKCHKLGHNSRTCNGELATNYQ